MEPHAALAYLDERGRLVIVSTTQVPFHARRIVSKLIEMPHRARSGSSNRGSAGASAASRR